MGLRERGKERRRGRIVDAARELISEDDGIEGLTMARLADRAEVSVATVYNLMGGREDVLMAVISQGVDARAAGLEALEIDDPIERIARLVEGMVVEITDQGRLYRPSLLAASVLPDEHRAQAVLVTRGGDGLTEAFESAARAGALTRRLDLGLLARRTWEIVIGQFGFAWARGRSDPRTFLANALYTVLLSLLAIAANAEVRRELEDRLASLEPRVAVDGSGTDAPS